MVFLASDGQAPAWMDGGRCVRFQASVNLPARLRMFAQTRFPITFGRQGLRLAWPELIRTWDECCCANVRSRLWAAASMTSPGSSRSIHAMFRYACRVGTWLVSPGRIRTDDHGPGQFRPQRHPLEQGEVCVRQRSDDHVSAEFAQAGDAVLPRIQPLLCRIEVAELAVVEVGRIQAELRKGRVEVLQVQPVQRHKLPAPIADRLH